MKEYILGSKKILTTPDRYEKTFKELGYIPNEEKKEVKKEIGSKLKNKKDE